MEYIALCLAVFAVGLSVYVVNRLRVRLGLLETLTERINMKHEKELYDLRWNMHLKEERTQRILEKLQAAGENLQENNKKRHLEKE